MAGGLVQIAVYGPQDIFLTGNPQITFFKIVYRRHTNFAIESIAQHFLGDVNFGSESNCVIEKAGDMINRVYLELEIPKVDLLKNQSSWNISEDIARREYETIKEYYQLVKSYISTNTNIMRQLAELLQTNNVSTSEIQKTMADQRFTGRLRDLRKELQAYISKNSNFDKINEFNTLKIDLIQQLNQFDISLVFNSVPFSKPVLLQKIIVAYQEARAFYLPIYSLLASKEKTYQSFINQTYNERYKFAWVEELAHASINQLDVQIGNQVIDRHTGDWLIAFNKIFLHPSQTDNYNEMIGNVPDMTNFDDTPKDRYKLILPLQFWFCRYTGLSLPLIALQYHDVVFNLKLKDLSSLCYVEDNPELSDIANIQAQYGINILNAKLYVDYVFLDKDERARFAQSSHEYLIETVQYNEFENITGPTYTAHLTFSHPTKFIIWFAQPNSYRQNPTGRNKCQWNNYGTNPDKSGYTMSSAVLRINNFDRTDPYADMKYYNYVQPVTYFRNSPTDGYNVYSFALHPQEYQPSGQINLSRIDDFSLVTEFTHKFTSIIEEEGAYVGAYVMSYNILRLIGGMGGLSFT